MNREIKFRAWTGLKVVGPFDVSRISSNYVKGDVLMQFTGLKDKKGEVYEGDVVRVLGMDWVVTWYGGAGVWWVNGIEDGFGKMTLSEALQKGGEVIGNMYETERSTK